jgi:hypothetical protein
MTGEPSITGLAAAVAGHRPGGVSTIARERDLVAASPVTARRKAQLISPVMTPLMAHGDQQDANKPESHVRRAR